MNVTHSMLLAHPGEREAIGRTNSEIAMGAVGCDSLAPAVVHTSKRTLDLGTVEYIVIEPLARYQATNPDNWIAVETSRKFSGGFRTTKGTVDINAH